MTVASDEGGHVLRRATQRVEMPLIEACPAVRIRSVALRGNGLTRWRRGRLIDVSAVIKYETRRWRLQGLSYADTATGAGWR